MQTLAESARFEENIRRSRFIAHAARVCNEAGALEFYESTADPRANHNCWAWRIDGRYRFNDDGEPSGSAGRPILAAIEGRDLNQVMIIVTRYFGGIKLGVGGLVRAYGGTASKCLDGARLSEIIMRSPYRLQADFALAEGLHQLLNRFQVDKHETEYNAEGLVMSLRLAETELQAFRQALADLSQGRARLERVV